MRIRRRTAVRGILVGALALVAATVAASGAGAARGADQLSKINHIVVIYEENHSFDNLYGGWEGVNGLATADAAHTTQVDQAGAAFACLPQNDVNIVAQSGTCGLPNTYFGLNAFLQPDDTTCPQPFHEFDKATGWLEGTGTPGGCTRDIVHRYYSEIYQLDGGKQDRYVTGSDAVGTVMGVYDTKALPIYAYLHGPGHPRYAIADDFFQAALGGSFLNHQWLIAARTPIYPDAVNDGSANDRHSVVDANGMATAEPLYTPLSPVLDRELTVSCNPGPGRPATPPNLDFVCGDFAVNTMKPFARPFGFFSRTLPAQEAATIGDRLTDARVDWAWYSGGWSNAAGEVGAPGWTNGNGPTCSDPNVIRDGTANWPFCADRLFQFHHQPFAFFANYGPGTPGRAHLQDEVAFEQLADSSGGTCRLKPVSFVKPIGEENEHPGYASEPDGSDHLVDLLQLVENSACAKDTMVVVTYDEFGGQWDHVPPPGQGGTPGVHDAWGPGTRIPALVVSPYLRGNFVVDHTQYDTTSILATIEKRWNLRPLTSRDEAVNDLSNVFAAKQFEAAP